MSRPDPSSPDPFAPNPATLPDASASVQVEGNVLRKISQPAHAGEAPGPSPAAAERRRSDRVPQAASAWLSNATDGPMTQGRTVAVHDLSLHGVGFTSTRPCEVGDRHWILVTQGLLRLSTRVRIASCRQRDDGQGWDIGGEFF